MFTPEQTRQALAKVDAMTTFEDANDFAAEIDVATDIRNRWYRHYTRAAKSNRQEEWLEKIKRELKFWVMRNSHND